MPKPLDFSDPDALYNRMTRKQNRRLGGEFRDANLDSPSVSDLDELPVSDSLTYRAGLAEVPRPIHTCERGDQWCRPCMEGESLG